MVLKGSFLYGNGSILYKKKKNAPKDIKTDIRLQKTLINHCISTENKKNGGALQRSSVN